jgi:hypothetical protein
MFSEIFKQLPRNSWAISKFQFLKMAELDQTWQTARCQERAACNEMSTNVSELMITHEVLYGNLK